MTAHPRLLESLDSRSLLLIGALALLGGFLADFHTVSVVADTLLPAGDAVADAMLP